MPSTNGTAFPLTVGKIESGMAIVLTEDLEMLEIPVSLLPPSAITSKVVCLQISPAPELSSKRNAEQLVLQQKILKDFATPPDTLQISKGLELVSATHTTVTVRWPVWTTMCPGSNATIYAIDGYLDGRIFSVNISPSETSLKLTGLEPNTSYSLKLIFRTSAGRFSTDTLKLQTCSLDDLSCLRVAIDNVSGEIIELLRSIGVQVVAFTTETSLIVSGRTKVELEEGPDDGELFRNSKYCNVPIVSTEWAKACKESGRMQSVSQFYIQ